MVREQEPARNPLAPSMGNSAPLPKPQGKEEKPAPVDSNRPPSLYPQIQLRNEPEFGKPTVLGNSPQPYSRSQPLARPGANVSAPRQNAGGQSDKY